MTNPQTVTKKAFIEGLPATMSVKEMVQAAKEKGIDITDKHVSVIRWQMRPKSAPKPKKAKTVSAPPPSAKAAKKAAGPKRKTSTGRPVGRPPGSTKVKIHAGSKAEQMASLIVELGLDAAEGIFERVRSAVRASLQA